MKNTIKFLILFIIRFIEKLEYFFIELDEDDINKKIIETISIDDIYVETDEGFSEISHAHITQPYTIFSIKTESGKFLECADNHILFDENMNEVFCKSLKPGDYIQTKHGIDIIKEIKKSKFKTSMFDISLNDNNHRYYSNDILSHNTITSAIFIVWYLCFHYDRNILAIANKMATTTEIIDKIRVAYQHLPFFLKPGVTNNGATGMKFDNGVRLFSQATTKTAAIGFTIHLLYADEFAHIPQNYLTSFYRSIYPTLSSSEISRIIISSTPNGMNLFYDIYSNAVEGKNEYKPIRIDWWQVPGKDEKWKKREIANLGSEELFNQEYGNQFLASSRMLLSSNILTYLKRINNEFKWKEVYALEDLDDNYNELRWDDKFDPNNIDSNTDRFVLSIDVGDGVGEDYTVCNIFKIEIQSLAMIRKIGTFENEASFFRLKQVGMWRSNTHSVEDFSKILSYIVFNVFNQDIVRIVLEINFKGSVIIEKLEKHDEFYPEIFIHSLHSLASNILKPGIKIKTDNKEMYSRELRNMIKNKKIIVTEKNTFNELGAFGLDKNGRYKAQTGHDDIAMTLINLVTFFENESFFEFIEDIFDKNPKKLKQVIEQKIDESPEDTEVIENIKWMSKYM